VAYYFYERRFIDKLNIQTFGRWYLTHAANTYKNEASQVKLVRQQQRLQQLLQQPSSQPQSQQKSASIPIGYNLQQQQQPTIDDIIAEELLLFY
jgi:hypothetical protein